MSNALLNELGARVSNWGRWGVDDEIGTPNTITPEKVASATALVRLGRVFSLAIPLDASGPQFGTAGRFNPIRTMLASGADAATGAQGPPEFAPGFGYADDIVTMPLQCATHWDGLGHVFHDGRMYNNRPASLVTSRGAQLNGVENLSSRIVTRGVLLDVARHRDVSALPGGEAITADELDRVAAAQGVEIEAGDALLVRTGFMSTYVARQDWRGYTDDDCPGLSYTAVEWLREKDVAAVASDTFRVEVKPFELPDVRSPFHLLAIVHMGLLLGEIFDLDGLTSSCEALGTWEFLFVALPLPFTGAVGSPVNPCAIL
jgi:kynurenine formamidase